MAPPDPTDPLIQSVDFSTSPRAVDEQSTPKWFTDYFKPVQAFVYNTTNSPLLPETALKQVAPSFALPILSVVDQFLMEDLMTEAGIWPPSSQTVLLSDLQLSLGKIFAAMVWYYRNGNHSSAYSYNPDWIANQDRVGEAEITIAVLRLRLNVSHNIEPMGA
ncbi:hypothetical protein BC629DRAFT_266995 [Irpex lacteus]|nr:hypothetical protein BC629DRAFT_266995 [Irpex lacteus]